MTSTTVATSEGEYTVRSDRPLPSGTVTFLLGDVEGSTRWWSADAVTMAEAVRGLDALVDVEVARAHGVRPVEQGEGDSFVAAFDRAVDAVGCALSLQRELASDKGLRVRMGLHSGEIELTSDGRYMGSSLNRCARLRDLAHGGQTLLSRVTADLVVDDLPDGATLLDLGSHSLRDLARPEHVYELRHADLPSTFPPLESPETRNNLPAAMTTFIGREADLTELAGLLSEGRVVTLTGAGGCGKTRLAIRVARDMTREFADGVWWIDFGPVSDPRLVPNAVAAALSVREVPNEDLLTTLRRHLRERRLLLLLDNCEHLVSASAELATDVASGCPGVTILATSREPLGVQGETAWRVPSLPVPALAAKASIESLLRYDGVRLFVERARRVRAHFDLTTENAAAVTTICQRLDGVPLALELAAAQVRVLTPEQIAQSLSDSFGLLVGGERAALPRQRTLEASVEWSHRLLSAEERTLLARLSVFAGGFTLDAAEAVGVGDPIGSYAVLDLLTRLVDKSLVNVEDDDGVSRYRLLETIRDFARRRLVDVDEMASARDAHLAFFLALAEDLEPVLDSADYRVACRHLTKELDNLRAALDWAAQSADADRAGLLLGALRTFMASQGHLLEALDRTTRALAMPDASPRARLAALGAWTDAHILLGDPEALTPKLDEAIDLATALQDDKQLGRALNALGWAALFGDRASAPAILERAIETSRRAGDDSFVADSLSGVGQLQLYVGNLLATRAPLEESLRVATALGQPHTVARVGCLYGHAANYRGEFAEAEAVLLRSLEMAREVGDPYWATFAMFFLGDGAAMRGDASKAEPLLYEGLRAGREHRNFFAVGGTLWRLAELALDRGELHAAAACAEEAIAVLNALHIDWGSALACMTLGDVFEARGDRPGAVATWELAMARAIDSSNPVVVGRVLQRQARVAEWDGDVRRGEELVHEALASFVDKDDVLGIVDALEQLGALGVAQECFAEATRLFAAAEAERRHIGYARLGGGALKNAQLLDDLRARAGDDAFDAAWEEGQALPLADAVAYARKRRGSRKRPSSGWASLTPAELQVTQLVAEGLTNPQIAERLFVSPGTVKVHLAHIFGKLGVTRRAELASEVTRRSK